MCNSNDSVINLFQLNIQSLSNKILQTNTFLQADQPLDILCINEHWLQEDQLGVCLFENYTLLSHFCRREHIHGGVSIFVHNSVLPLCKTLKVERYCKEIHAEFAAIKFRNFNIISLYRSTKGSFDIFLIQLELLLTEMCKKNELIIISGDFNTYFNLNDNQVQTLRYLLRSFDLKELITSPTRGKNCLDNIFTNLSADKYLATAYNPGLSDHAGVCITFMTSKINTVKKEITHRPVTQLGLFKFYNHMEQVNWDFVDNNTLNCQEKFDTFYKKISNAVEFCFPLKTFRTTNITKIKGVGLRNDLG